MKHLFTFLFLLSSVLAFSQNTYSVCNIPGFPANFSDLQTAINTVPNGSILNVQGSGTSYGTITVNKPIVLRGTGYNLAQNAQTQANYGAVSMLGQITFDNGSNGSEISGFELGSVYVDSVSNLTIKSNKAGFIYANFMNNSFVKGNFIVSGYLYNYCGWSWCTYYASIYLTNSYNSHISNNILTNNIHNNGGSCTVFNNICMGGAGGTTITNSNIYNNIFLVGVNFSGSTVNNNLFVNFASGYGGTFGNIDNVSDVGLFVGYPTQGAHSDDGRYQLAPNSPAIGAGVGGVDCGAFGGSTPYRLSGIAAIPNIWEGTVPSSVVGPSLNVNIKANANE